MQHNLRVTQLANASTLADWLLFRHGVLVSNDTSMKAICQHAREVLETIASMSDKAFPNQETLYHTQQEYHRLILKPIFAQASSEHSKVQCEEFIEVAKTIDHLLLSLWSDSQQKHKAA